MADLLAEHGRVDEAIAELRALAIAELRALAATDAAHSQSGLTDLLAKQGRERELRAQAVSGNPHARHRLVALPTAQGLNSEAAALERFGLNLDGSTASPSDT